MPVKAPENWARVVDDENYVEFDNNSTFGYSETVTVVQVGDRWHVMSEESDTFSGTEEEKLGEHGSREAALRSAFRYMRG